MNTAACRPAAESANARTASKHCQNTHAVDVSARPAGDMSNAIAILYSTSVPTLPKVRADIATIKRILDAKKVAYEEVDLAVRPERREEMLAASGAVRIIPQLHFGGRFVGTADEVQELEDFGQLDAALGGR